MISEQMVLDLCLELGVEARHSRLITDAIERQTARFPTTFETTLTALFTEYKAQKSQQDDLAVSRQNALKKAGSLEWDTTGNINISITDVVEDSRQKLINLLDISSYFEGESTTPYGFFRLSRG